MKRFVTAVLSTGVVLTVITHDIKIATEFATLKLNSNLDDMQ